MVVLGLNSGNISLGVNSVITNATKWIECASKGRDVQSYCHLKSRPLFATTIAVGDVGGALCH